MENQERPNMWYLLADILLCSSPDTFSQDIQTFLDETAETLGIFIGVACSDPDQCIIRFRECMIAAAHAQASKSTSTTKNSETLAVEAIAKAASKH